MPYSISQVEELTGVKPHILRYWEQVMPCFSAQKDFGGRRIYTQKDVEIINRLNYLINNKNLSIKEARKQLILEMQLIENNEKVFNIKSELNEIRTQLFNALTKIKKGK